MDIGILAVVCGLIMMGIFKIYEARKKESPRVFAWILIAAILAISLALAITS